MRRERPAPEHNREQAECLRTQQQNKTRSLGLWSECSRLIANCIIYYNATILSHLLAHKENTGDKYGADLVKEVSPVAWQHINLYGRYEFREQPAPVDVEEIVRELADIQIETDSTLAA